MTNHRLYIGESNDKDSEDKPIYDDTMRLVTSREGAVLIVDRLVKSLLYPEMTVIDLVLAGKVYDDDELVAAQEKAQKKALDAHKKSKTERKKLDD